MTHVSLFTGIGGIDLAAEWAGFTTIAQVEKDDYCQRVLAKHWPDVHRVADVRDFPDAGTCDEFGIPSESSANRTSSKTGQLSVTLVSGGFPCQPFSAAGKRRGTADDRHLWPQMLRVIRALTPLWVLAENVPGLLAIESGMAFETVLTDLEAAGYETWAGVIPAAGVGAPHLRYRVFVVGHAASVGCDGWTDKPWGEAQGGTSTWRASADVADATSIGSGTRRAECARQQGGATSIGASWWAVEPAICRVASGIPHRVDRLRCLGNAVVPQAVYPILRAIAEIENVYCAGAGG